MASHSLLHHPQAMPPSSVAAVTVGTIVGVMIVVLVSVLLCPSILHSSSLASRIVVMGLFGAEKLRRKEKRGEWR